MMQDSINSRLSTTLGDEVEVIDLAGAVMFPGFTDAHAHL